MASDPYAIPHPIRRAVRDQLSALAAMVESGECPPAEVWGALHAAAAEVHRRTRIGPGAALHHVLAPLALVTGLDPDGDEFDDLGAILARRYAAPGSLSRLLRETGDRLLARSLPAPPAPTSSDTPTKEDRR